MAGVGQYTLELQSVLGLDQTRELNQFRRFGRHPASATPAVDLQQHRERLVQVPGPACNGLYRSRVVGNQRDAHFEFRLNSRQGPCLCRGDADRIGQVAKSFPGEIQRLRRGRNGDAAELPGRCQSRHGSGLGRFQMRPELHPEPGRPLGHGTAVPLDRATVQNGGGRVAIPQAFRAVTHPASPNTEHGGRR